MPLGTFVLLLDNHPIKLNVYFSFQRAWFRVQQLMDHEKERRGEKSWMLNHILVVVYLQKIFAQAAKNTGCIAILDLFGVLDIQVEEEKNKLFRRVTQKDTLDIFGM